MSFSHVSTKKPLIYRVHMLLLQMVDSSIVTLVGRRSYRMESANIGLLTEESVWIFVGVGHRPS